MDRREKTNWGDPPKTNEAEEDDSASVRLERDAEEEEIADGEDVQPLETPVQAARSRRRSGRESFSAVMRKTYDINVTTPFGLDGNRRRSYPRRGTRNLESLLQTRETQDSEELSASAAVNLGPDSLSIAQAGQSSLATSVQVPSGSVTGHTSPPQPLPAPRRGGFGFGGRGAFSSGVGGRGGRPIQSSGTDGSQPRLQGSGGRSHRRSDFAETRTITGETPTRGLGSDTGDLSAGAGARHQGLTSDGLDTPHNDLSYRDVHPNSESVRGSSGGRLHQGGDSVEPGPLLSAAPQDLLDEPAQEDDSVRPSQGESPSLVHRGEDVEADDAMEDTASRSDAKSFSEEVPTPQEYPDYASLWVDGPYQQSRAALAARAYMQARALGWTDMVEYQFRAIGLTILSSIPTHVLTLIMSGNLAEDAEEDQGGGIFADDSPWMHQASKDAPMVYVVLLVDQAGKHLSRDKLYAIIQVLRRYTAVPKQGDDDAINEAVNVDNAFKKTGAKTERKHIRGGRHRFLWKAGGEGKQGKRRLRRIVIVQQFCDAVEARIRLRHIGTLPLQYFGYAFNFSKRTPAHQKGEGSSFLLQLVRCVCEVLWPGECRLAVFPVFFACDAMEAKLGEMLLTLLGHGLAETGMGLAIHQAGINNASADMMEWPYADVVSLWNRCKEFRADTGFCRQAMDAESEIVEQINGNEGEDIKKQKEELERLRKEIKEEEELLEEEFGTGVVRRVGERFTQEEADRKELLRVGGAAAVPLAEAIDRRLKAEKDLFKHSWPFWHAGVRKGLD